MSLRDTLLALLIVIVWGVNFIAIKLGVGEVPPLMLTCLRFVFTALPAILFFARPKVSWWALAAFGTLLGTVKFGLVFSAIKFGMPAGLTSLVMQLQVFFTFGLAFLLLRERPTPLQYLGAGIAFAGIAVFALERAQGAALGPFLMIIAAAFAWGCANIVVKKAGQRDIKVDMLAFLVWSSLFSPLPLALLSIWLEGVPAIVASLTPPSLVAIASLAFIVGPSTLFAFAMWNALLQKYPTSTVAPFALLVPVIGILSGVLILGEPFSMIALTGSAIVFFGLIVNVYGDRIFGKSGIFGKTLS